MFNFMEDFKHLRLKFKELKFGVRVDEVRTWRERERERKKEGYLWCV
jgi:hypothetical protein